MRSTRATPFTSMPRFRTRIGAAAGGCATRWSSRPRERHRDVDRAHNLTCGPSELRQLAHRPSRLTIEMRLRCADEADLSDAPPQHESEDGMSTRVRQLWIPVLSTILLSVSVQFVALRV